MNNTKDSFFSMDRLVEFGMGMAMSQQIVQNMNNMMASMRQPPLAQEVYQPLGFQTPINPAIQSQPVTQQSVQKVWSVAPQQASQSPASLTQAGMPEPPPVPQPSSPEQNDIKLVQSVQMPIPEVFYISQGNGGKTDGPYSGTEIARLVAEKKVVAQTPVWKTGLSEWKTAAEFPDLVAIIALVPPEFPKTNTGENR